MEIKKPDQTIKILGEDDLKCDIYYYPKMENSKLAFDIHVCSEYIAESGVDILSFTYFIKNRNIKNILDYNLHYYLSPDSGISKFKQIKNIVKQIDLPYHELMDLGREFLNLEIDFLSKKLGHLEDLRAEHFS